MGSPEGIVEASARRGRSKGFVVKRNPENLRLVDKYNRLPGLFGTPAKVDSQGMIFIPTWRDIPAGEVDPTIYTRLQKSPLGDAAALKTGWKSKESVSELIINPIKKDDGSVKTAIRFCDHVLESVLGQERDQVVTIIERADNLLGAFDSQKLSEIGTETLKLWQEETMEALAEVGLTDDSVVLPVKKLMIMWSIKGSGGMDSWGRLNDLTSEQELKAARKRAQGRKLALENQYAPKYIQMREALMLAGTMGWSSLEVVADELENRFLPNRYLANPQQQPDYDLPYTRNRAMDMSLLLTQAWVRPYRPIAMEVKGNLDIAYELLTKEKKGEIFTRNLPQILAKDVEKMMAVLS